jgi:formylglycine-generating enzyme required for sulfatase activity
MPLTQPLDALRKDLQDQLLDDIAAALRNLQALLPATSDKYGAVVALLGRLNDANKARLRNTLSNDDLQREYDRIRADFLDLVQGLQEADFSADSAEKNAEGQPAPKQGSILYRIPGTMPVRKETKCVVRISMDEDAIAENITIDEHVQLKSLYRVSDTMQAELLDPAGGRVFSIRTISEDIQLVDQQGFTEWWFYVTPLEEGSHPLVLKIAIIEMVNGLPHRKEIVMEEIVRIIADGPVSDEGATALRPAGYALAFQTASMAGAGLVTGVKQSAPVSAPASTAKATSFGLFTKTAILMLALSAGTAAGWFASPEESRDWWKARYLSDNYAAYSAYLDKYPDGKHYAEAACKKTLLEDTPKGYRDYLYEFPEGACRDQAEAALKRLENEHLEKLRKNPTEAALRAYMIQFPECDNLDGVYEVVVANPPLREKFLPVITQRWEECKLLYPSFPEVPVIENLPTVQPDTLPAEAAQEAETREQPPAPAALKEKKPAPATHAVSRPPMPVLVLVPGGKFPMGSTNGLQDEQPVREVSLQDFYLGKTEVTFDEYDRFCEATGRAKPDDEGWGRGNRPVIHVSWLDAAAYCNWLSTAHGLTPVYTFLPDGRTGISRNANGFRLPTEAQWEYAACGKQDFPYSGSTDLNEVAWYLNNSGNQTHPVAHKAPNALGLYDLTGNVREWCQDWYGPYPAGATSDPVGAPTSKSRVLRGGHWGRNPEQQRITYRNAAKPDYHDYGTGFRLARLR